MTITASVVLDSIAPNGARLTTFELTYPRFIHAGLMTHRAFSRNSASSRAIPTRKKIERIRADMAKPCEWGLDKKGMQPDQVLSKLDQEFAEGVWEGAARAALTAAETLDGIKVHKQVANRILEPFDHITVVLSTTKLKNHFLLRLATDPKTGRPLPDPNYFELATKWKQAFDASSPVLIQPGEWHLPYVYKDSPDGRYIELEDGEAISKFADAEDVWRHEVAKMVSVGRCARVSYMRQGQGDVQDNVTLHARLLEGGHWAPFEHVATPIPGISFLQVEDAVCGWCWKKFSGKAANINCANTATVCMACAHGHVHSGNFHGWHQHRKDFPGEAGGD